MNYYACAMMADKASAFTNMPVAASDASYSGGSGESCIHNNPTSPPAQQSFCGLLYQATNQVFSAALVTVPACTEEKRESSSCMNRKGRENLHIVFRRAPNNLESTDKSTNLASLYGYQRTYMYLYRMSQEERSIFWEVIVSAILSKNMYTCMCPIPYGFREELFHCTVPKLLIRKICYVLFLIPVSIVLVTMLVQSTSMHFATRVRTWSVARLYNVQYCTVK
jgi:hypothetical protein